MATSTPLKKPILVAMAQDSYLTPSHPFGDGLNLPGLAAPMYGQDITYGTGRKAPGGQSVGTNPADLKAKFRKLLAEFAAGDKAGMSKRLFDEFLTDSSRMPMYFEDKVLNATASAHKNVEYFCSAALSAPTSVYRAKGKTRIHQALKAAKWDITKIAVPTDLGVPAFNDGNKAFGTGDFNNGLGLMINGVQNAYVFATAYRYDAIRKRYCIDLGYVMYDVFGLDDGDLAEYGAASDSKFSSTAAKGITAWWQLQHQHGYAPLVTRIIVQRSFEVPAS